MRGSRAFPQTLCGVPISFLPGLQPSAPLRPTPSPGADPGSHSITSSPGIIHRNQHLLQSTPQVRLKLGR